MTRAPSCPACGTDATVAIVYGMPGPALMAAADRGEVALGGCVIHSEQPNWHCPECGHEFE